MKVFTFESNDELLLTEEFVSYLQNINNGESKKLVILCVAGMSSGKSMFTNLLVNQLNEESDKDVDVENVPETIEAEAMDKVYTYNSDDNNNENNTDFLILELEGMDNLKLDSEKKMRKTMLFALLSSSVYIYMSKNEMITNDVDNLHYIENILSELLSNSIAAPKIFYILNKARNFICKTSEDEENDDGYGPVEVEEDQQKEFRTYLDAKKFKDEFIENIEGNVLPDLSSIISELNENETEVTAKNILEKDDYIAEHFRILLDLFARYPFIFTNKSSMSYNDFMRHIEKVVKVVNSDNFSALKNNIENQIADLKLDFITNFKIFLSQVEEEYKSKFADQERIELSKIGAKIKNVRKKLKDLWKSKKAEIETKFQANIDAFTVMDLIRECKSLFSSTEDKIIGYIFQSYEKGLDEYYSSEIKVKEEKCQEAKKNYEEKYSITQVVRKNENALLKNKDLLTQEVNKVEEDFREKQDKLEELNAYLSLIGKNESLESLSSTYEKLKKEEAYMEDELIKANSEIERLNDNINAESKKNEKMEKEHSLIMQDKENEKVKGLQVENKIKELIRKNNKLEFQIKYTEDHINSQIKKDLKELRGKREIIKDCISNIDGEINDLEINKSEAEDKVSTMESQKEKLEASSSSEKVKHFKNEIFELQCQVEETNLNINNYSEQLKEVEYKFLELNDLYGEEQRRKLNSEYKELKEEYDLINSRILNDKMRDFEKIKYEKEQYNKELEGLDKEIEERQFILKILPNKEKEQKTLEFQFREKEELKKERDQKIVNLQILNQEIAVISNDVKILNSHILEINNRDQQLKELIEKKEKEYKSSEENYSFEISKLENKIKNLFSKFKEKQLEVDNLCETYLLEIKREYYIKKCLIDFKSLFKKLYEIVSSANFQKDNKLMSLSIDFLKNVGKELKIGRNSKEFKMPKSGIEEIIEEEKEFEKSYLQLLQKESFLSNNDSFLAK